MAYKILTFNPRRNTHHFFIDEVQDTQQLPKEPASTAFVAATGDTYICTNDKQWVLFKPNHGGNNNNIPSDDSQQQDNIVNEICYIDLYMTSGYLPDNNFVFEGCEFYLPNDLNNPIFARINSPGTDWMTLLLPQGCIMKLYYNDKDNERVGSFVFNIWDRTESHSVGIYDWVETDDDPIWKESDMWTYKCAMVELPMVSQLDISIDTYNSETNDK